MKDKKQLKIWIKIILAFSMLFFVFLSGYAVGVIKGNDFNPPDYVKNTDDDQSEVDFRLFWQAWKKARELYIGDSNPKEMLYGAISGMVESLGDPYTTFLKPVESQRLTDDLLGEFEGIGAELMIQNQVITVVSPLPETPSEKAGLKAKDIIIKIDDQSTENMSLNQAVDKIRGKAGTTVKLSIIRSKINDPIEISIERAKIEVPSVTLNFQNYQGKKLAVLKITQFGDDTVNLATKFAEEISNSDTAGIIIDLRNNPGGYLDSSVKVAGLFIEKGSVAVIEVDKTGKKKEYKTENQPLLKNYPTIALVNGGTASAAEIVTGALLDHERTEIVGEKTFGKGSVQAIEPLLYNSSIKVTIAKWLTPKSSEIDGVGINPQYEVKDQDGGNQQLSKAKELLFEKIK